MAQALNGKVAIVTGGSRGIGAAIAERLARDGAKVVVNYVSNADAANAVVKKIEGTGGKAVAVKADVGKVDGTKELFDQAEKAFGQADILINNAGVILYKPLADVTEQEFDKLFNTNVKGTFFGCQQAAKRLRDGGVIVNFSSTTTVLMLPTYAAYVATKGAVEQMTHVLAKELGGRKIRVNVVSPGPTDTELLTEGKTEADLARMAGMAALGRLGTADDIAKVVAWLCSEEAYWVTGQNIRANGGVM